MTRECSWNGVAERNRSHVHDLDTDVGDEKVTQKSAADRDALRDTADGDVTGVHSMAHVVSAFARPYVLAVLGAGCVVRAEET